MHYFFQVQHIQLNLASSPLLKGQSVAAKRLQFSLFLSPLEVWLGIYLSCHQGQCIQPVKTSWQLNISSIQYSQNCVSIMQCELLKHNPRSCTYCFIFMYCIFHNWVMFCSTACWPYVSLSVWSLNMMN